MRPIFAKELRGLVPLWVLCFLGISGDLLFRPITERLDENSWADISAIEAGSGGDLAFVFGVLAFVVAYAAFPREHDEGTMGYLRSLPVSRSGIFFGKVLAGLTVLVSSVAMGQFTNFVLASFSPQTFEGNQFRWSTSLTLVFIQGSFVVAMYCHGVFASFFRRFGLLPYTLVFWVAQIAENIDPTLAWLSPVSMVRLTYFGQTLLVPLGPIIGHLIFGFVMLALAGLLWLGPTERVREFIAPREGRSGWAALGFGCSTAILVFVMFCAVIFLAVSNAPDDAGQEPEAAEYVSFTTADAQTEHYAFTYPVNLRERALRLVGVADATFEAARATLGATASDGPISVDLAEVSSSHEGIAAGARVRMGLVSQSDLRLRYVLAHESTHVFQGRESRSRLAEAGPAGRFLSEGSADWVAHEVVDAPQMRAASRVVAAVSWERHDLRFEDIVDDDTLRARYDTTLVYSLGEAWSEALERACGEHALGRLLRALAADDAPRDIGGFGIVQDGLQRSGCSYEQVDAAWVALLTQTAADSRAALDALPRMGAAVEPGQDAAHVRIVARLDRAAPEGATFSVRFRRDRGSEDSQMRGAQGRVESPQRVVYEMPTSVVPSARFELQLCVAPEHTTWTYCEPWQAAALP